MSVQGRDVVLQSMSFAVPPRCASCGGAQETTLEASKRKGHIGGGSTTRTFQIPYCNACAARARGARTKGYLFAGMTAVVALLLAALGLAAPGLPAVVLVALPTILALGVAILAMTVLAPKAPPAPATASGEAVRLVSFSNNRSTLYCTNPQWGDELAYANSTQAVAKSRASWFGVGSLWVALLLAPAAAGGVWMVAHPKLHVDNATAEALQVWVDGKPEVVVPANAKGAPPPSVWLAYGKHTLGASKVGATKPESTVDANLTMMNEHLYNPDRTACYWVVAHAYGHASVHGVEQGPQPVRELYTFDKVNTWFGTNPQSITVQNGQSGDTRIAVQRAAACTELAEHGCSAEIRTSLVECQHASQDDAAFDACADKAAAACGLTEKKAAPKSAAVSVKAAIAAATMKAGPGAPKPAAPPGSSKPAARKPVVPAVAPAPSAPKKK